MSATDPSAEINSTLGAYLGDPASSFSIGAFGAVAEFSRSRSEAAEARISIPPFTLVTRRGAVRFLPCDGLLPCAYETVSTRKNAWLQGLALCLEAEAATCSRRRTLTEIGCDVEAIRAADRDMLLFDLGLALGNADFCIRTRDPELIARLRKAEGSELLRESKPLFDTIISHHPHRVVTSRVGRIEVFQPIGRIATPEGPHTHVLPKLLRSRRTHDTRIPIPEGYLPCLHIYPGTPEVASSGAKGSRENQPIFDALLEKWGNPRYVAQKKRLHEMLRAGCDPLELQVPPTRLERVAVRVGLRQCAWDGPMSEQVSLWRLRFDP